MKRLTQVRIVGGLMIGLGIAGLSRMGSFPNGDVRGLLTLALVVLGLLTVTTGTLVYQQHGSALRTYGLLVAGYLIVGAVNLIVSDNEPMLVVSAWLLIVGALFTAFGAYLRSLLRQENSVSAEHAANELMINPGSTPR